MLCDADSIGVFQIESRAQMNMLPRLKPRTLLRPGDGDRAHPAGADRRGHGAPVPAEAGGAGAGEYPSEEVREILEKTLGVPLFQEQAMKLAMVVAGFTPAEADGLRRALSHKRAEELLGPFHQRFVEGGVAARVPARVRGHAVPPVPRVRALRLPGEPLGVASRCWRTRRRG